MSEPRVPLSMLDLAVVGEGETAADALAGSVALAQAAEERGYERIWYAEHHNMASIASAATSVLIAHVAAHTETITLGSGGIMLPNHSPLVIAEQFGTLACLHPGRIELGLGRAPGTDQATAYAMRRNMSSTDSFPKDVLELQAYLAGESRVEGVNAIPGINTNVPLTILGSSLYGAELAARLGLSYAFASHFAPAALVQAMELYRDLFEPSAQLDQPCAYAAINVVLAETEALAQTKAELVKRRRVASFLARGGYRFAEDELDGLVASPQGQQIVAMMKHTAIGTPEAVRDQLNDFAEFSGADKLIVVHQATNIADRVESVHLLANAYAPVSAATSSQ